MKTLEEFKKDHEADSPERLKRNLDRLLYAYKKAEAEGQERMGPRIAWLQEKLGVSPVEKEKPPAEGAATAPPVPDLNFQELWDSGGRAEPMVKEMLSKVKLKGGVSLEAGDLTARILGMGLTLIGRRRVPPGMIQYADFALLGVGGAFLILENLDKFKKPKEEKPEKEKPKEGSAG